MCVKALFPQLVVKLNFLPSLEYGRLSNPSAEDIPSWIKVLDVTDLSLSDKFFEQMPTGIDRIYAPSNELTSLRISLLVICLNFKTRLCLTEPILAKQSILEHFLDILNPRELYGTRIFDLELSISILSENCNATEIDFSQNKLKNIRRGFKLMLTRWRFQPIRKQFQDILLKFRLSREDFRCKKDLISISLSSNDLNHLDEDIFADLLQITSIQLSIKDFNSSKRLIRLLRINRLYNRFSGNFRNDDVIHVKHRRTIHRTFLTISFPNNTTKYQEILNVLQWNQRRRFRIFRSRGGTRRGYFRISNFRLPDSRVRVRMLVKSPKIGQFTEKNYKSQKFKCVILRLWQYF